MTDELNNTIENSARNLVNAAGASNLNAIEQENDRQTIKRRAAFVAAYNLAFLAFLLLRPVGMSWIRLIDNVAQFVGPALALPWVFVGLRGRTKHPDRPHDDSDERYLGKRRRAVFYLGLTCLSYVAGQIVYTIQENVLHVHPNFSLADFLYMLSPPLLLVAILVFPARPIPAAARTRIVLDGLVIMTAAITFTWYFILGPLLINSAVSPVERALGAFYPLQQLLTVYCIVRLSARHEERLMRPAVNLLCLAMLFVLVTQSTYGYLLIHNAYVTGTLLDAGWPLGTMSICLAASAVRMAMKLRGSGADDSTQDSSQSAVPSALRSLLPYAIVPIVVAFVIFLSVAQRDRHLVIGVYVGAAILVLLTLLRQSVAFIENARLYGQLAEAYEDLALSNRRAQEHADAMERMNGELKAMQNELVQSAKLASLGTLSTGVAHELNQPLAVIRGTVQQMRGDAEAGGELQADLELVEGQTTRMMKIIQHLRTFARASKNESRPFDVNKVIEDCFILVGAQLKGRGIEVSTDLSLDEPRVIGEANEFEQVVLNIITNAQDALEGRPSPSIHISTASVSGACVIVIRDNGPGVPEEIAEQIFDPFFTTKETGKGTGLGLSISHSIIQKHRGTIRVENNGGAVFTVTLPLATSDAPAVLDAATSSLFTVTPVGVALTGSKDTKQAA